MAKRINERINYIIQHIDLVLSDTKDASIDDLKENSLLLRATCFSISQIGEAMNKLKELIGEKYPDLPWIDAKTMRNVIVNDYKNVVVKQVYGTIKNDLPVLKEAFERIKNEMAN